MRKSGRCLLRGKGLSLLLVALLTSAVTVGCGPQYATDDQMMEYAATVTHGEKAEFVEKIGDRRLHFKTERGVEFDVWTFDKDIKIDGSHVCYTDEYGIADDYEDGVCNLYKAEIEKLIADCGFKIVVYSPQFDCLSAFTLAIDEPISEEQTDTVNAFLTGLRDIAKREAAAHSDGFSVKFDCNAYWHGADGYYKAGITGEGWNMSITASTPDASLDIRQWAHTNALSDNVVSPDRNGVLLEVAGEASDR